MALRSNTLGPVCWLLIAGTAAIPAAPALAQSGLNLSPAAIVLWQPVTQRESEPSAKPRSRDLEIRLRADGEIGLKSDFRASEGDVQVSRVRAALGLGMPLGDRSTLDISFDNEWSFYDFSGATGFGSTDPWDNVWERGLRVVFSTQETANLAWFIGGDVTASGENGADFGDSVTYGGLGGVKYHFSDSFTAGIGIYARSRLEESILFLPYFAFEWKLSPAWVLSSLNGRSLLLSYAATDTLSLFLEGGYEAREFRLDDQGPSPDGLGKDRRAPVAVGAAWNITPKLSLTGKLGAYAWQRYRLDESDGTKIAQFEADPAAFFAFEVRFAF